MAGRRAAELTAWGVAAVVLASQLGICWLVLANRQALPEFVADLMPSYVAGAVLAPAFPALGAVILRSYPRHPIAWIMTAVAGVIVLDSAARAYAIAGLYLAPERWPGAEHAAWFASWNWLPSVAGLLVFVPLLFPDGRLPSRRWRGVAVASGAWIALASVGHAVESSTLVDFPDVTNPVQVPALAPLAYLMVLFPVAVAVSMASVLARRRRARGDEREQLRWLAWALGVAVVGWTAATVLGALGMGWGVVGVALTLGSLALLPVAITVAIVKYRLYDIDALINRTLVYGGVTAAVLAAYAAVVVIVAGATGSTPPWRWSALVVAAVAVAAYPLHAWLQRRVNRLMYGDRDEPARALSEVSRRISDSLTPASLLPASVDAIRRALRVPYVAVRLASDAREPAAESGALRGEPHRIHLVHQGEAVGVLLVGRRSDTEPFSARDLALLDDVARQVAVAAHTVQLASELQRSRERLVLAREEERRRLRRDLHDGVGSALAGLVLHAGNARQALPGHPDDALRWTRPLEEGIRAAVADVRRIVDDLRPPALDELGLGRALQERAEATYPGAVVVDRTGAAPLPAAVEVAAYRIAAEAVANVARHTRAGRVTITLALDGPSLVLDVVDDGPGLPRAVRSGVGLRSMRERAEELGGSCRVATGPGGGTLVRAALPLPTGPLPTGPLPTGPLPTMPSHGNGVPDLEAPRDAPVPPAAGANLTPREPA